MKTFKDTAERTWTVAVNVAAVKRVRDMLGINLSKVMDEKFKLLSEILEDPCQLVDVVYCLCKEQADAQGVSDVDFGKAMGGDSVMAAGEAFIEALTDFFPNARARAMLTMLMTKGRKVRDILMDKAEVQIAEVDESKIASTLIASFGNSPESSA